MTPTGKSKNSVQTNRMLIVIAIVAAAVIAALALVVISSQSTVSDSSVDYDQIPQARLEDGGFVLGAADAPITILAFEDFLCPSCQRYKPTVDALISRYVALGMARFEYRFLPAVDPTYSTLAAQYAECADTVKPGSFWDAHDTMYEITSARRYTDSSSRDFAERMDIAYTDLLECAQDAEQVYIDSQLASQLGANGTPTVFIRYGDGAPQPSPFGTQPTIDQLGVLIEGANS